MARGREESPTWIKPITLAIIVGVSLIFLDTANAVLAEETISNPSESKQDGIAPEPRTDTIETVLAEEVVVSTAIPVITTTHGVGKMEVKPERTSTTLVRPNYSSSKAHGERWSPSWRGGKTSPKRDSYLEALRYSRTSEDLKEGPVYRGKNTLNRRDYIAEYGTPEEKIRLEKVSFGTGDPNRESFSLPSQRPSHDFDERPNSYTGGSRVVNYGPPENGHSQNSYGDYPGPSYSSTHQAYGAPIPNKPYGYEIMPSFPEMPTINFSWPFAHKLSILTLAKIILKLVIFKMIVKFIAVICLLLFIPKLEIKKSKKGSSSMANDDDDDEDSEDEGRVLQPGNRWLAELTSTVLTAYEKYERLNGKSGSVEESTGLLRSFALEEMQRLDQAEN